MKKAAQIIVLGIGTTILLSSKAFAQGRQPLKDTVIDTSSFTIRSIDWSQFGLESGTRTTIDTQELLLLDSLVRSCIREFNAQGDSLFRAAQQKYPNEQIDREDFFLDSVGVREYVPIINAKGEKHVWVFCFPEEFRDNIKKHFIIVQDGGNRFFDLKINLTERLIYDLHINSI